MDLPADDTSSNVHAAKEQLFAAIEPIGPESVAKLARRGQYIGYPGEAENLQSSTETYASLSLQIDNDRWRGVPINISTGKAMNQKLTEVKIGFVSSMPDDHHILNFDILRNTISLKSSDESSKTYKTIQSALDKYQIEQKTDTGDEPETRRFIADGYERVLQDAMAGDHKVFTTSNEVLYSWKIIQHVQKAWSESSEGIVTYPKGSKVVG